MTNINDKVIELDIACIEHSDRAYNDEKLREMFWSGELTDIPPLDDQEFIASDYGYEYCDNCDKWIEEE